MKSIQLRAVAMTAAENLVKLIEENADEILSDIQAVSEEAQNQEADKIIFSLNHTIKLNLTAKAMVESLSWNVRKKLETAFALPDPEQPELPINN
jgi:ABC-type branched-subunit amino acid transport system ATPase component